MNRNSSVKESESFSLAYDGANDFLYICTIVFNTMTK